MKITYAPLLQSNRVVREFWDNSVMVIDGIIEDELLLSNQDKIDIITLDSEIYSNKAVRQETGEDCLAECYMTKSILLKEIEELLVSQLDYYQLLRDTNALVQFPDNSYGFVSFDYFGLYKKILVEKEIKKYRVTVTFQEPAGKIIEAKTAEEARGIGEDLVRKSNKYFDNKGSFYLEVELLERE